MASPVVRRILGESVQSIVKDVILKDLVVPRGLSICPHCQEEIHEKGVGYREESNQFYHGKCGGAIRYPVPEATIQTLEQSLGMRMDRQTGKWTALVLNQAGQLVDPATGT